MKKIHFSNVDFSSSTGPNTFGHRLASSLANRGYEIVNHSDDYDVFLCFIEPLTMPNLEKRFIHRLDGIWFKPEEFKTHNKAIKWAYNNSHHVIWQSEFDKKMTQKWWGDKKGSVVHNGIKIEKIEKINNDIHEISKRYDRIFTCSASWHRQKRLKENIEFFNKNKNKNDALLILGKNPDVIVNDKNIFYLGHLSHELCLQVYSITDWFLHLAWLDHCPNVVIEALSQGCSIICSDSGGTKEIVKENGIVIKESNRYNFELTDYDKPYKIELQKLDLKRNNVNPYHLDIKLVCDKYEEIFKWD